MEDEQLKEYFFAFLRTIVPPVAIILAKSEYLTENQAVNILLGFVPIIGTLIWSLGNKYIWNRKVKREKRKVEIALQMPEGTSKAELNAVVAGETPLSRKVAEERAARG